MADKQCSGPVTPARGRYMTVVAVAEPTFLGFNTRNAAGLVWNVPPIRRSKHGHGLNHWLPFRCIVLASYYIVACQSSADIGFRRRRQ